MVGECINTTEWVHGKQCVICVNVQATRPADDPDELYFDPATVRHLECLQALADSGNVDELVKHGTVYVRRSA